jgi:hypothetical protein
MLETKSRARTSHGKEKLEAENELTQWQMKKEHEGNSDGWRRAKTDWRAETEPARSHQAWRRDQRTWISEAVVVNWNRDPVNHKNETGNKR